jgi:hypothetical protein
LCCIGLPSSQAKRVGLLVDIREVFDKRRADKIRSADLVAALVAMEGHPWAEYGKAGKPLSANGLARMLANDGISPNSIRLGEDTGKGYERTQFDDAFARYLPPPQISTVTPSQPLDFCGSPADLKPSHGAGCDGSETYQNARFSAACDGVTVANQCEPPKSQRVRVRI